MITIFKPISNITLDQIITPNDYWFQPDYEQINFIIISLYNNNVKYYVF